MLAAMDAAERGEEQAPALLAGKYKSVEDLENGYKELQRKLSQPRDTAQPEGEEQEEEAPEPEGEEQEEEEEDKPESRSAREIYGDLVGGKLEEAGIDFVDMNDRFQKEGSLADEDYDALQEAGFSRDMVDSYLAGIQVRQSQDNALALQQVNQLKSEFGGDQGYQQMIEWAAQNLSAEEIEGFDQIVTQNTSIGAVRMAIAGLHARYTAAEGREPRLLGGRAPSQGNDKFESTAQVVEAMKDPRYASDPAYRKKVEQKLARSSVM